LLVCSGALVIKCSGAQVFKCSGMISLDLACGAY
jgi:hypothetical protein